MKGLVFVLVVALICAASAEVVELNGKNFKNTIGQDKGVLVKFFAPWCGHCKKLAPEFIEASEDADVVKHPIVFAEVDCDSSDNKGLCSEFGVRGYPTLKWFPKGSKEPVDYEGARSTDALVTYALEQLRAKKAKVNPVMALTGKTFEAKLKEGDPMFVKFFAPWCGHCKALAPAWAKLSATFENEAVVIAEVDCDSSENKGVCSKYGVSGFPTILFFEGPDAEPEKYEGGRTGEELTTFVNEKVETSRIFGGGLLPTAGRVAALDEIVVKFMEEENEGKRKQLIADAEAMTVANSQKADKSLYVKIMLRVLVKGNEWPKVEAARVARLLESALTAKKESEFKKRENILSAFYE